MSTSVRSNGKHSPGTTSVVLAPLSTKPRFEWSATTIRGLFVAIVVVAVVLRVGSALYQGDHIETLPGIYDQVSYDGLAQRVVQGYGFSFAEGHWPATQPGDPTAHWSFLYTLYLAAVYAIFGVHPLAARLIQAILAGVLQTWLMWRLGRRLFGPIGGLFAAAFGAIYIYFVYYAGALITETFYIIALLWMFDVVLRIEQRLKQSAGRRGSRFWLLWIEFGVAIGVAALLRQLVLLIVPFMCLWLWWRLARPAEDASAEALTAPWWRRWLAWQTWRGFVVAAGVALLLILPWTVRNYFAFHSFVLLNTNAGYVFFWGNHPIYGSNFIGILPSEGPQYADLLPRELLGLNEADLDRALLGRGLGFVRDDPGRYLLLSLSRAREYFKFWPSADSGMISNVSRVGSFGLFLPLMLYGVVLAAVQAWRRRKSEWSAQVILLLGFIVLYTVIHMLTWTLIRYRLPVDAFLLLFAAYGVLDILQRLRLGIGAAPEPA